MLHLGLHDIRSETIGLGFSGGWSKTSDSAGEIVRLKLSNLEFLAHLEKLTSTLIKPVRITHAKHVSQVSNLPFLKPRAN